jgi:hypothetical protein
MEGDYCVLMWRTLLYSCLDILSTSYSAIITAGSDSLIRVFKTAKDERDAAATTIDKHSEAIQSIAVHVRVTLIPSIPGVSC